MITEIALLGKKKLLVSQVEGSFLTSYEPEKGVPVQWHLLSKAK